MPSKKVLLLFTILLAGCSSNIDFSSNLEKGTEPISKPSNKLDYNNFEDVGFVESRRLLSDALKEDNVNDIQKLAINLGLIKPMFVYRELDEEANFSLYYSYTLELRCGNDAYKEALDNIHFRKAIFSLFDHNNFLKTTHFYYLNSPNFDSNLYGVEPSNRISEELSQVVSLEGIDEAKIQYELALEKGLPEKTIEVYVSNTKAESIRTEYLNQLFLEVFGDNVKIVSKNFYSPYYYAIEEPQLFSGATSFVSEFHSHLNTNGFELLKNALYIHDSGYNGFSQYNYEISK